MKFAREEFLNLMTFKDAATIPLPLDYPVHDMRSWLACKPMFQHNEHRIDWAQADDLAFALDHRITNGANYSL